MVESMRLSHHMVATAQVGLSYLFLAGFFACVILYGLGYFKNDIMTVLTAGLQLMLSFWFMRQRTSDPPPETKDP